MIKDNHRIEDVMHWCLFQIKPTSQNAFWGSKKNFVQHSAFVCQESSSTSTSLYFKIQMPSSPIIIMGLYQQQKIKTKICIHSLGFIFYNSLPTLTKPFIVWV